MRLAVTLGHLTAAGIGFVGAIIAHHSDNTGQAIGLLLASYALLITAGIVWHSTEKKR